MLDRIARALLLLFLATIGVNWPQLPLNASIADFVFVPLAIAIVAIGIPRSSWHRSDLAIVIYLFGALPAIAVSTDLQVSAIEFLRELYLVAIYIVIAFATRHGFVKTIGRGLALSGTILAIAGLLFVILQLIGGPPWYPMGEVMQLPYLGDTLRLRALTASEAMFACVLTASAPFAIALCSDRMRQWCAAAIAIVVAAMFTVSHAIAGFSIGVLLSAWRPFAAWPQLRRLAIAAVVIIVIGFNFAATISVRSISRGGSSYTDASNYFHSVDKGTMHVGSTTIDYDVMSYARIKQVAWRTFLEHPIAGIGLDRFHIATMRAYHEGQLPQLYSEIDPHSTLLGRLAESGAIGAATLLFLWIVWIGMARDCARDSLIGVAAAAAFAGLLVNSLNADIMNFRFLWAIAGLMRGLYDTAPNSSTPLNDHGHAPR